MDDTRAVDNDLQAAELRGGFINGRSNLIFARGVGRQKQTRRRVSPRLAGSGDTLRQFLSEIALHVRDDYACTFSRKEFGGGRADARGSAADPCDLPG